MPNIEYQYRTLANIGFPVGAGANLCGDGAGLQGVLAPIVSPIGATWPQLINATLISAILPGPVWLNVREANWRQNAMRTASRMLGGYLVKTPVQYHADPSDKAALAEAMGTTMTCFISDHVAGGFPANMIHLSRFEIMNPGAVVFGAAARPDYISQIGGVGPYQIWEAKGSGGNWTALGPQTGAASGPVLRTAIQQCVSVATVFGGVPDACVGCMAQGRNTNRWRMVISDPSSSKSWTPDPAYQDATFVTYYEPLIEMIDYLQPDPQRITFGSRTIDIAQLSSDVVIGIDVAILDAFANYSPNSWPPGKLSDLIRQAIGPGYAKDNSPKNELEYLNGNGIYTGVSQKLADEQKSVN
ncbi:MAG: hypothetical protein ABID63_02360 [Pseudomonadota bacterium]